MQVAFHVEGVRGKQRPRFRKRGGTYTPHETEEFEQKIANAFRAAAGRDWDMYKGEVAMEIATARALPKSRPKRVESEPDIIKPDVDNIAKIVLDGLNGVAYADDAQVTRLTVVKMPRIRRQGDIMEVVVIYGDNE